MFELGSLAIRIFSLAQTSLTVDLTVGAPCFVFVGAYATPWIRFVWALWDTDTLWHLTLGNTNFTGTTRYRKFGAWIIQLDGWPHLFIFVHGHAELQAEFLCQFTGTCILTLVIFCRGLSLNFSQQVIVSVKFILWNLVEKIQEVIIVGLTLRETHTKNFN